MEGSERMMNHLICLVQLLGQAGEGKIYQENFSGLGFL